jgi:hypothetical protein
MAARMGRGDNETNFNFGNKSNLTCGSTSSRLETEHYTSCDTKLRFAGHMQE